MTGTCKGCEAPIPPSKGGRPRKWCSQKCRRETTYQRFCVDCDKKLSSSDGNGPNAPIRCGACGAVARSRASGRAERVLEMMRLRTDERLTNIEIGERMGVPVATVASELSRLRALGFAVPAAPYNNATVATPSHVGRDALSLGRALERSGVTP
jgi:hypothetical protein